jgi:S-adenosylmethionine-diacylglycerol 3-amino-3-carboxypropyl transferase
LSSEIESRAEFSEIRYAQCWEDADILVEALNTGAGKTYVSIASAGDNSLSLLTLKPERVIALDLNPSQIACLELRVAAFKKLNHGELLELIGSRDSNNRRDLFSRCENLLSRDSRAFWNSHLNNIDKGIGNAGKFEKYFRIFRTRIIPLIHSGRTIDGLFKNPDRESRIEFYDKKWNNWRWRLMFKIFFSRAVMGRMGRDPEFFKYVEGNVASRILSRTKYALTELNPAENPYIQWIMMGTHLDVFPHALRESNFDLIRENIDKIEWHLMPLEEFLAKEGANSIDSYNLSDIFEYMSEENYHKLLGEIIESGRSGGRIAYWNMLVPRSRPKSMAGLLVPLKDLSDELFVKDKAFFYSRFVVEEFA